MSADVAIRAWRPDDVDDLYGAVQESVTEVSPWMPWCHPAYGREDARWWIEQTIAGRRDGSMYDFAMTAGGKLAGGCGINHINAQDRFANLGYWVRTSRAGEGVTPRAVRLLIDWAFAHTDLERIEIVAAVGNLRSQRVAEKVGACREAVLARRTMTGDGPTDAVMYCVLRPAGY
jgi:ribosomal-protein-serine acetyltransferase